MKKIIIITLILVSGIGIVSAATIQKVVTVADEVSILKKVVDVDVVEITKSFTKPTDEVLEYSREEVQSLIDIVTGNISNHTEAISTTQTNCTESIASMQTAKTNYETDLVKYQAWLALFPKVAIIKE